MRLIVLVLILLQHAAVAQLVKMPIPRKSGQSQQHHHPTARKEAVVSLQLPFWDDFSVTDTAHLPISTLWQYRKSVTVTSGMGINNPSINAISFDGLDSIGRPYSSINIQANGIADQITSKPINLSLVPADSQDSVYLSFYYEFQGNGEAPDAGDDLTVWFKNGSNKWNQVWSSVGGSVDPSNYAQVLIAVNDTSYFHDGFQFRFQNYGRLSGPWDTWNVDYIYLNQHRTSFDNSYPDRAITSPLTSLFKNYFSIPYKHFLQNADSLITHPTFGIYNFLVGNQQPLDYFSYDSILTYRNKTVTRKFDTLDNATSAGFINGLDRKTITVVTLPNYSIFDPLADSIVIKMKLGLATKDNKLPSQSGDYDPFKYSPLDFRNNDTLRSVYHLCNYYGYDDGTAEFGAGLNQPGAQLAYEFDMKQKSDTVVAVQIYFPQFGDASNVVLQLQIRDTLTNLTTDILDQESIVVQRTEYNKYTTYPLSQPVPVKSRFYVGWKQNSGGNVPAGLDINTDSFDKIFYNLSGAWVPNLNVHGSLMIHPVFGSGKGVVVAGLKNEEIQKPFPNPSKGTFSIVKEAVNIQITDITGRAADFETSQVGDYQQIILSNSHTGLYIVRYHSGDKMHTDKILIVE